MTTSTATRPDGPWFIADERALDFINTLAMAEHSPHDFLQSDEDVLLWLNHVGFAAAAVGEPGELLAAARALRTTIRELVTAKKRGEMLALNALNTWLAQAQSYLQISDDGGKTLSVERKYSSLHHNRCWHPLRKTQHTCLQKGSLPTFASASTLSAHSGFMIKPKRTAAAGAAWPYAVTGRKWPGFAQKADCQCARRVVSRRALILNAG